MGENEEWPEQGGPLPNGLLPGAGPVMQPLDTDRWIGAEECTADLIACIQPNPLSEERRNAVADYVQRLIMKCFPSQVCTFGSVPLKTYLPDGDIDLTAFSNNQNLKDSWANQVRDMLENEEKNENAEFHVKEVQYIQAEVKIIKCLVENIVVDISFNQVGGLCTLCFLDEVDNLINQNHLFKRSIILIKAWCYYESRILGAHHGLISTYALETLVLYIFHVFNNSFHGPLEVLYRFLEFFSNFDWDNFCVSLLGPVPISSLPISSLRDVTEPPRKDSGELLLSKLFLDACSSVYAVFPGGQENNGQPFVSKHFNVIDPLRVNNNLGRSVSKGNFFRIRSAFAFGAKRLARLLDCPKENITFEVNQFFMNTWERHGSGHRPDAPVADSQRLRGPTSETPGFGNSNNDTSGKNLKENSSGHASEREHIHAHGVPSQHGKNSSRLNTMTSNHSATSHTHSVKSQFNLSSLRFTDKIGKDTHSDQPVLNDNIHKGLKLDLLVPDSPGRLLFARTHSSPDLTDSYSDDSSQVRHSKQAETAGAHATYSRLDSSNRKMNLGSESMASYNSRSSVEDTPSLRHNPSPQSLDAAESRNISNSYHRDLSHNASSEEFMASSGGHAMQQEEQDIVNMMSSASLQGMNDQIHLPVNLASGHLPYSIPPSFIASMGYNQHNIPGLVPSSIPLMDPSLPHVQFPHGLVPPQLSHYFPTFDLHPSEDSVERTNESFGPVGNSGETNGELWQEQGIISSSVGYDPERNLGALQSDDKPSPSLSSLKYVPPPSRVSGSSSSTRVQQKYPKEKRGIVQENIGSFLVQDTKNTEAYADERPASTRFSSAGHNNSLRSRTSSESSWDGSSGKVHKSMKEKRGKKIVSSDLATGPGKGTIMAKHAPNDTEDDDWEWGTSSNVEAGMIERNPGPDANTHLQVPRHYMPGFEGAQTSGSEPVIPFAPMLIGPSSRQRASDNSGVIAFYPTGPPIPFLTMLPVYNIPPGTSTSDALSIHFGGDETLDNESGMSFSPKRFDQPEDVNSSSSVRGPVSIETSEEQKPDILNSDFASHWQNLQFGRFCQSPRYQGPLLYPSPVMVPPVYVQGRIPYENPGRGLPTNSNLFSQLMASYGHRVLPISPPQSVSTRHSNIYQSYVDDLPRYRGGTGTYLPNPKVSVRERHSSGSRRGNYNHDRNDSFGDREGSWSSSKSRSAARNRNQADKSNSRTDRSTQGEVRADRSWNSYRYNSILSNQLQNGPLRSNPPQNSSQSRPQNIYPLPVPNPGGVPNGPVPPMVMLYPFDHNGAYVSHGDQLEFGSLGPVGFPSINEQLQLTDGGQVRAFEEHRFHGSFGHRSPPDQPSSPHHQRRAQ